MAKLGETVVSSAISGKPLTLSDTAFAGITQNTSEVAELKGQVAALLALIGSGAIPTPVAPVEPVEPAAKPTKAAAKEA